MIKNAIKTIVAITLRFDKPLYFYVGLNCSQHSSKFVLYAVLFKKIKALNDFFTDILIFLIYFIAI